ncbi:hypothetical protein OS493_015485 [Desmophyllum pertusum]|uniref:Uncharacterized protein n=1 Tax=Desmophyllum pertusum TaxID=174260 RepID=A0A9W9Z3F3_9CNID|nr:hypothetical protein OS493_015485 [Desmophyllum pertusum]
MPDKPSDSDPSQLHSVDVSNSETVSLISSILDAKLQKTFDKSPAGWAAVEEYESDDLADDSEDEKKLRAAERRALSRIKQKSAKPRGSRLSNAPQNPRQFQATQVPGS